MVLTSITYWNENRVYVDIVSRLSSQIKISFGRVDYILQIGVRFIMIMVVNGHLATQYPFLDKNMCIYPMFAYTDICMCMGGIPH